MTLHWVWSTSSEVHARDEEPVGINTPIICDSSCHRFPVHPPLMCICGYLISESVKTITYRRIYSEEVDTEPLQESEDSGGVDTPGSL